MLSILSPQSRCFPCNSTTIILIQTEKPDHKFISREKKERITDILQQSHRGKLAKPRNSRQKARQACLPGVNHGRKFKKPKVCTANRQQLLPLRKNLEHIRQMVRGKERSDVEFGTKMPGFMENSFVSMDKLKFGSVP